MSSLNNFLNNFRNNKPNTSSLYGGGPSMSSIMSSLTGGRSSPAYQPRPASQFMSTIPANPSAVPAAPSSPARSQYTSSLGANSGSNVTRGQYGTITSIGGGTVYSDPRDNPNYKGGTTNSSFNPTSSGGTPVSSGSSNSGSSGQSAYLKYRTGMFDEDTINNARTAYEDSQKRLADIQSRNEKFGIDRVTNYNATLDKSGGLKAGAEQAAGVGERRASQQSAYNAIEESAAARSAQVAGDTYDRYIAAGKSVEDAQIAATKAKEDEDYRNKQLSNSGAFNLSEGETRYDAQGNKIAFGGPKTSATGGSATGTYTEGENPAVDSWIKYINGGGDISKAPANLKNLIVQGLSSGTGQAPALITDALDQAKTLLADFDSGRGAIGAKGPSSLFGLLSNPIAGTSAGDYKNKLNSFKAKLSLEAVKYLKGQGAVSDAERRLLEDSVTELGTNQSEGAFKQTLTNIISTLSKKVNGASASGGSSGSQMVVMTGPDGTFNVPINQVALFKQNGYQ